jgi:hypothetical protein
MAFRLKLFGLHLLTSACVLALVWAVFYFGWYRWPGWYLTGVLGVAAIMAGVDVVLGPSLTLIIANPNKTRRELTRDIGVIAAVQLVAMGYGAITLWHGRPLYYTYSERFLQIVQASDLDPREVAMGQKLNPALAPHWYSLPRWIYVPLPKDPKMRDQIVAASITGGDDVIQMPRYYQPWQNGLADLRSSLRVVSKMTELGLHDKERVGARMKKLGLPTDQPIALPMLGRGEPLVAVFDPGSLTLRALVRDD